jgi:hypothetical protein
MTMIIDFMMLIIELFVVSANVLFFSVPELIIFLRSITSCIQPNMKDTVRNTKI